MEGTRKWKKVGFSTILWAVLAVALCAAPPVQADTVPVGEEWDIPSTEHPGPYGFLSIYGTANILSGAIISYDLEAYPGSEVNIRGGSIGNGAWFGVWVSTDTDPSPAVVTVYGTEFAGSIIGPITDSSWTPDPAGEVLSGKYEGGVAFSIWVESEIPINLAPIGGPMSVDIDIKPGSYPNSINLGSHGVVPVAILSTADFDATLIPADTVFLAGSGVRVRGKGNKYLASEEDVNGDGLLDLVVKVETENLDPGAFQDGGAFLRVHETSDPESPVLYEGWDEINIVPQ